jgi:tRNA G18 (ribose-2'-O)-methylase SpoU
VTNGLGDDIETYVRIPMLGEKRSLNVATAAGIVLYELLRRRSYKLSTAEDAEDAEDKHS